MSLTAEDLREIAMEDMADRKAITRADYRVHDVLQSEWRTLNRAVKGECTTDPYTEDYDLKHGGIRRYENTVPTQHIRYDVEVIKNIVQLHDSGISLRQVSKMLKVPSGSIGLLYKTGKNMEVTDAE